MSFLRDLSGTFLRYEMLYFTTLYRFIITYRQTIIGPLWVLMQPLAFILFLGALFTGLSSSSAEVFIPHLGIGYVAWTLLGGYLGRSPGIFTRNKPYIVNGNRSLTDAVMLDNLELIVQFIHRVLIVIGICLIFKTTSLLGVCKSILGFVFIIFNGYCFSMIMSILSARFKDLTEAVIPLTSIFFLATPIIWMPVAETSDGKTEILSAYMNFNPFYHYLEIFRAPLLSNPIGETTLIFVGVSTLLGLIFCCILYAKTRSILPHWLN